MINNDERNNYIRRTVMKQKKRQRKIETNRKMSTKMYRKKCTQKKGKKTKTSFS